MVSEWRLHAELRSSDWKGYESTVYMELDTRNLGAACLSNYWAVAVVIVHCAFLWPLWDKACVFAMVVLWLPLSLLQVCCSLFLVLLYSLWRLPAGVWPSSLIVLGSVGDPLVRSSKRKCQAAGGFSNLEMSSLSPHNFVHFSNHFNQRCNRDLIWEQEGIHVLFSLIFKNVFLCAITCQIFNKHLLCARLF